MSAPRLRDREPTPDEIRDVTLALGGCPVRLRGCHPVLDLVVHELAGLRCDATPAIDVRVSDEPLPEPPRSAVTLGAVTAAGDEAWFDFARAGFRAHVAPGDGTGPVRVWIEVGERPMPYGIPRSLFRWAEPTFMTPEQAQAYVLMLRIVEGMVFLYGGDTVLAHASCVEHHGRALALVSAGGVGKTTTAATLLDRPGWRYVADDILPLAAGAGAGAPRVRMYPRRSMVYAYNVDAEPRLRERVLADGGLGSQWQWRLFEAAGIGRRRRRVPAAVLHGEDRIGDEAELTAVAFLTRHRGDAVVLTDAAPDDLARRARAVMANEQAVLGELVHQWEAAGTPPVTFADALERHERVYERIFSAVARCTHARLPFPADPGPAATALGSLIEGAGGAGS